MRPPKNKYPTGALTYTQTQIKVLEEAKSRLEAENAELQAKLREALETIRTLQRERDAAVAHGQQLQSELDVSDGIIKDLQKRLTAANQQIKDLDSRLASVEKERDALRTACSDLERNVDALKKREKALQEQVSSLQDAESRLNDSLSAMNKKLQAANETLRDRERAADAGDHRAMQMEKDLDRAQGMISDLEGQLAESRGAYDALKKLVAELEQELENVGTQFDRFQKTSRADLAALEARARKAEDDLARALELIRLLEADKEAAIRRAAELAENLQGMKEMFDRAGAKGRDSALRMIKHMMQRTLSRAWATWVAGVKKGEKWVCDVMSCVGC